MGHTGEAARRTRAHRCALQQSAPGSSLCESLVAAEVAQARAQLPGGPNQRARTSRYRILSCDELELVLPRMASCA